MLGLFSLLALAPLALAAPIAPAISKRGFSGKATYYDPGLGACGGNNGPGDFIVALNAPQFGDGYPGPNCGKSVTISYGGKSTQATIVDKCPGCAHGALDMSPALFEFFADQGLGVFQMEWSFNDGSAPANTQKETPKEETPTTAAQAKAETPAPTTEAAPTTQATTTTAAETTTAAPTTTLAPTTTVPPSSSSSLNSTSLSSSASSSVATVVIANATTTIAPDAVVTNSAEEETGNLSRFNLLVAQFGRIVVAGGASA